MLYHGFEMIYLSKSRGKAKIMYRRIAQLCIICVVVLIMVLVAGCSSLVPASEAQDSGPPVMTDVPEVVEGNELLPNDEPSSTIALYPWTNVYDDAYIGYSKFEKNGEKGIIVHYFDFQSMTRHSFELYPFAFTVQPILIRSGERIYVVTTNIAGEGLYAEHFDYDHLIYTLDIASGETERREYDPEVDLSFSTDMMVSPDGTKLMVKGVPNDSEEINRHNSFWIFDLDSLKIEPSTSVQEQYEIHYGDVVPKLNASEAAIHVGTNSHGNYYMVHGEEKEEKHHYVWQLWCREREGSEHLLVKDLYPIAYSGPVFDFIDFIYITEDYAYYAGSVTNQDDEWTLLGISYYVAELESGKVKEIYFLTEDDNSEKSAYNRMIGEYGEFLVFLRPLITRGFAIDEDGVVMVRKETFLSGEFKFEHFSD